MPAPDVVAVEALPVARPLYVHLHAKLVTPEQLAGGVVVVIDNLRASVTMTAALYNGAERVIPTLTVEDALAIRARSASEGLPSPLLGGERGGVLIPGFDLDNSPRAYTREKVAGRTVVFTTVNGTAALLQARLAARVLVGSFVNLTAVCDAAAGDERPVHLLCCGTREDLGNDDILPAGAMVEKLVAAGRGLASDDSARLAAYAWKGARGELAGAMADSRGGRGLARVGLTADLPACAAVDSMPIVPEFDAGAGAISVRRAGGGGP